MSTKVPVLWLTGYLGAAEAAQAASSSEPHGQKYAVHRQRVRRDRAVDNARVGSRRGSVENEQGCI